MKTTIQSGREGEEKAIQFLVGKGWKILAQNYRYRRGELDIIGIDQGVLVFVEVKFRKNDLFGFPEEFVDTHKEKMIRKTALEYVLKENWEKDIRFDIIAITGSDEPEHFEDAF